MSGKKFLVITASDSRYGDFLINHWLVSLLDNIDNHKVQIAVLDYGLSDEQRIRLRSKKVIVQKCKRDGHVVNIRFRDALSFVSKTKFEQVLICDSGDIIFQRNIMSLFEKSKDKFRAVVEENSPATIEMSILKNCFSRKFAKEIVNVVGDKSTINGGLIVADKKNFMKLCMYTNKYIINKKLFGPDQSVLNYVLYKEGFVNLGKSYNYVLGTVIGDFKVRKGKFYDSNDKLIHVVHNAGGKDYVRIVSKFGYGEKYNKVKYIKKVIIRNMNRLSIFFKPVLNFLLKRSFR